MTCHESTGLTPSLVFLGCEVCGPTDVNLGMQEGQTYEKPSIYVQKLKRQMEHAHDVAHDHLGLAVRRQREIYDSKVNQHQYQPGDLVWLLDTIVPRGATRKLLPPYQGPYMVTAQKDSNYQIRMHLDGN